MNESTGSNGLLVLIVEDNRTQAEYLQYILAREGYETILASDGYGALSILSEQRPDIILTDVMMPDMNGFELCKAIKNDEFTREIPVILVTHLAEPADVLKGLESGADNFIIKPFEPKCLLKRIESTINGIAQPDPDGALPALQIAFSDSVHTIQSGRTQILNILLSTYETAVRNNIALHEAHDEIQQINCELKQTVNLLEQTNEELYQENNERQQAENALTSANNKLKLMTSITRHDLLNQLHALQGYLELSETDWQNEPSNVLSYLTKATAITRQMINTATFTGQYQEIGVASPQWMELKTQLNSSISATNADHIDIQNQVPEKIEVYADPMIVKVFSNLIENAVRCGETITKIRFFIEDREDPDNNTVIVCEDDGVGIAPEEKEKIFQFKYGGNTGLGLFLAREILSITGISIRETGRHYIGARFEIICPPDIIRKNSD